MISSTRYHTLAEINRQNDLSRQIAKLQESVTSGVRLSAASDDPAAAERVTQIRQTQADQLVWTNNVSTGNSIASAAEISLTGINDLLNRAKELVLSGRNDTTSTTDRTAITTELQTIIDGLNTASTANDPTGAPLYPTTAPIQIPVSDGINLAATAQRDAVFGGITTSKGTQTLQEILGDAISAINGDPGTRATEIQSSLDAIDAGIGHITQVRTEQGVRAKRFDTAKDDLATSGENLSEERNGLEGTDFTYALSEFSSKQTALQAAQTIFARTNSHTLFDLMG